MSQRNLPLISIIIPYYNCEKYIAETLASVEAQTYPNIEVILVNDGSSKPSTGYIEALIQDKAYIQYLYQENKGLSSARNTGAKFAQGEFLLFLDADDKIEPLYLQKTIDAILSHPNCKLAYSKAKLFDAEIGVWNLPAYSTFDKLLQSNMIYCSALHRKSDFTKLGGFDENLSAYEDWDYWIRLLQDGGEVIRIDEILFSYRKRIDNTSITNSLIQNPKQNKIDWQKVCIKHQELFIEYNLSYIDYMSTLTEFEKLNKEFEENKNNIELIKKENADIKRIIDSQKTTIMHLHEHNQVLLTQQHDLEKYRKFKKLWIIRLLKPFIKLEQGLHSLNRYRKAFRLLMREKGSFGKAYQTTRRYYKANGLKSSKIFLKEILYNQNSITKHQILELNKKFNLNENFVILTTKHTHYIAKLIANAFEKVNVKSEIIFNEPASGYSDHWHIVICPQIFNKLPDYYLAFQMEQSVSSRWFTDDYFNKLKNARFVFDYSLTNIEYLHNNGVPFSKLFYMPVGLLKTAQPINTTDTEYEYDVAFYGDPNCERRQKYLKKLQENFNVKVISEVFGDELHQLLKKAKVIVNIHYYEGALLETTRIYECLSLNKIVVSESATDQNEHASLESLVDFVDIDDTDAMIERIQFWLNSPSEFKNKLIEIQQAQQQTDGFEFYFYRFLLSQDLIDFDQFYKLCADFIQPKGDFWCLSLPESTLRQKDFQKDNKFNVWLFTGLRHHIGWIGCGLSYKFMMKRAEDLKLPLVTICEDDVLFYDNFEQRYLEIIKTLKTTNEWDIFSGLIADLSEETEIGHSQLKSKNETFYSLNKLVSMVFNIYHQSSYAKIYQWDYYNPSTDNTIDRFIESHGGIKGLIVSPYLVGHKEDLDSTLWGVNNSTYKEMIKKSQNLLNYKISLLEYKETP